MAVLLVSFVSLFTGINRALWIAEHPEAVQTRTRAAIEWYFELVGDATREATTRLSHRPLRVIYQTTREDAVRGSQDEVSGLCRLPR